MLRKKLVGTEDVDRVYPTFTAYLSGFRSKTNPV